MKIGKVIKTVFAVLFLIFIAFLLIRIFMLKDNRTLQKLYPTEPFANAYNELGDDAFYTCKPVSEISTDGYFSAFGVVFADKYNEMQITAKYNDSLTKKYLEGAVPEDFLWVLCDENGETVSNGTVVATGEKYQYNYCRIVFDKVDCKEHNFLYMKLVCEKLGYPTDSADPKFVIYKSCEDLKKYIPDKNEISMLKAFGEKK